MRVVYAATAAILTGLAVALAGYVSSGDAAVTTVEAETMTLGTAMEVRTGPPAHVALLGNSGTNGLRKTVTTGAFDQVTLNAWAKQPCSAWPIAEVYVDGTRVGSPGVTVNTTTRAAYNIPVSKSAGSHSFEVRFNNDAMTSTCDINLYVDNIVVSGPDPTPTPTPTATPTATPTPTPVPSGPSFPRLQMTHFIITSAADATSLGKWDWVFPSVQDTVAKRDYWDDYRAANPNGKISAFVSGTEDNGARTTTISCKSPDSTIDGFSTSWLAKNYDGSNPVYPGYSAQIKNVTQYAPLVNGKNYGQHLADWIVRCVVPIADGVMLDMTNDSSLYAQWPFWKLTDRVPNIDLDRNGVRDITEHGEAWVNNTWGAGTRDMVSRIRAAVPAGFIVGTNSGNGRGFSAWANGQSYEHGNGPANGVVPDQLIGLMQQWDADHFGTGYSVVQSQAGGSGQTNYKFFRHNLAATLMSDAYFGHGCGAPCNYNTLWWYDEYSVNTSTGVPTGNASRKGYLGRALGAATHTGSVWRRDFENGIALLNQATTSQTVSLGGSFRRINGTQDHAVNSGATGVTSVSLPAQDGLILLR